MKDIEDGFSDLEERIPGSKKSLTEDRAKRSKKDDPEKPTGWDRRPVIRSVGGRNQEFFTIGALCEALGKKPQTIRKWIRNGWLPKARYRLPVATSAMLGTATGKRLWSRAEVEGIIKIAEEEGIVRTVDEAGFNVNYIPDIRNSKFVERVWQLWKETSPTR